MWLEPVAIYIDENGAEMYHRECFKNNIFNIDKGGVTKFPRLWSEIKEEFEEKGSISNG